MVAFLIYFFSLERIYKVATERRHISLAIELLNLQALALHAAGETNRAMTVLEQALALAEPGGFLRIFVDEGPSMARLLYEALSKGIAPNYVQKLLAAFPVDEPEQTSRVKPQFQSQKSEWIEPLSDREMEVLHLMAQDLSYKEIADQIMVSLNTVRTHIKNIYSKLMVHKRSQAVAKAKDLNLL